MMSLELVAEVFGIYDRDNGVKLDTQFEMVVQPENGCKRSRVSPIPWSPGIYEVATHWTLTIIMLESTCLFAGMEQAGNLTAKLFSNSFTWYLMYRSMVMICISLFGSTFPNHSI